jgi:hypothetical protein
MNNNIVINDSFEILTPNGWQLFSGIKKSKKQTLKIKFQSNLEICCTEHHRFVNDGKLLYASELKPKVKVNGEIVVSVRLHEEIDVYDPINVQNGNIYYADNLVSHNCKFLGSALTLIRADAIEQMSYINPILQDDGLDVYEYPVVGQKDQHGKVLVKPRSYVLVVDTAQGVGGDYSAFVVIDVTEVPYKMVAKYRNNSIAPLVYPSVIYKVASQYNQAYVLLEVNMSEQVAHILYTEYEYENIFFVSKTSRGQQITGGFGGAGKTRLGVHTDRKIKRIGCFNFKSLIEEKKLLVFDSDVISEMSTFIEKHNSYEADEGYHDDLVMCLVLFGWLTTNPFFKEITDVNLRQAIYEDKIKQIEEEMLPIGFLNDGQQEEVVVEGGDVWGTYNSSDDRPSLPPGYLSSRL